jgi:hypothetical protein
MLRAIIRHIRRILAELVKAPFRMAAWLFGTGGPPSPPSPEFEEVVDDQVEELREELEAGPPELTDVNTSLGERIHEYASGDRDVRDTFDMAGIPEHVAIALLTMPPDQLLRLASAGPQVCGRWAAGEKTGLVSVPLPRKDWIRQQEPAADETPSAPAFGLLEPALA